MWFEVFGRQVQIEQTASGWAAFYPGADGKKRQATDIFIPATLAEEELADWLADLCHEWATPARNVVRRID